MPIYEYDCFNGHKFERYLPLVDYSLPQVCECGLMGKRFLSPPLLVKVQPDCRYDSPVTGAPITTMAQRAEDMKRHDCVPYDPELKTDQLRHQQDQDAALDKSVDEHVERVWETMPTAARSKVASEVVEQGATVNIIRTAP